ncbi:MAG: MFS transporter [Hyphomicrobiales bacterium]|nr:MFS transporter [Hyphomicrobiales bacterium]
MTSRTSEHAPPIWLIPLVVASALFMENMDASVIATSLPAIARDLGEDPVILKLALTSYLLSLAVFIPISGWCADRFGARPVFQTAIVVFIGSSIACAMSGSLFELIMARAAQGVGGAMMMPVGRLIMLRAVPKTRMIDAMAYLTIPALMAPVIGPPLGGYLTTFHDWRWIFWINVPFGLGGIVLAHLYMPNARANGDDKLDWTGFFLAGAGLATLIFGFTVYGRDILPNYLAPSMMGAGVMLITAYVMRSRSVANPILDLELLRIATLRTSVTGGGVFRLGIGAIPFLLPLMLQVGFGLDAFRSGLIILAGAFGAIVMKFTAAAILRRWGFRTVLTVNALICTFFVGIYAVFTPATPHLVIAAVLLVGGFFRSLQFTALNAVAYADIPETSMSRATALVAVAQQLFTSAGVAFAAFVLETSRALRGDDQLTTQDFTTAFLAIASLMAIAAFAHWRLQPDAGADVSRHRIFQP